MIFENTKIQMLSARNRLKLGHMPLLILTMCLILIFICESLGRSMCNIMSVT